MSALSHIQRCVQLKDEDVRDAVESRSGTKALLDHLASVAKPNEGAAKILLVFARMATTACEWLDGDLRVEIMGDGDVCIMELMTELGGGLRERALPSFAVAVPLSEFAGAVSRVPRMIEPLVVKSQSARRLVFVTGAERAVARSLPPERVAIADQHLVEPPRILPPKVPRPTKR